METYSLQRRALLRSIMHSGLHRLFRRELRGRVMILKYHHISGPEHQGLFAFERGTSLRLFRRQMEFVRRSCKVIPLEDLADPEVSTRHRSSPRPLIALTFDDGYLDNLRHALPVLQELELPATFFIATGYVGGSAAYPRNRIKAMFRNDALRTESRAAEDLGVRRHPEEDEERFVARVGDETIKGRPPAEIIALLDAWERDMGGHAHKHAAFQVMDWSDLDVLLRAGMTIGAHTVSHLRLQGLTREQVLHELRPCRDALQERLGGPINCFAFPDGRTDLVSHDAVAEEFALACNSTNGIETLPPTRPHSLPRASPPHYFPAFVTLVSGVSEWWHRRRLSLRDGSSAGA